MNEVLKEEMYQPRLETVEQFNRNEKFAYWSNANEAKENRNCNLTILNAAFLRSEEADGRLIFHKNRMNSNNEATTLSECCGEFFQFGKPKKWSH